MLFNSDNYPTAVKVLAELGFAARTQDGRSTIPNLMALFNLIFPKNQETYEYAVTPLFLETFQQFFPHGSAKIALNEYLNISARGKWTYGRTVVLYK